MIDPVVKQDLLLIRHFYENQALGSNNKSGAIVPLAGSLATTNNIHDIIQTRMGRYPSTYIVDQKAKSYINKSLLEECIPCFTRISSLIDLDMSESNFTLLGVYNNKILESSLNAFKLLTESNTVQQDLCQIYLALRANCVPDIRRLIMALTFLIADLRSFDIKSLWQGILSIIGSIIANAVIGATINFDIYIKLITETLQCIVKDINAQLSKLEPILSKEGRKDTSKQVKDAWVEKVPSINVKSYGFQVPVPPKGFIEGRNQTITSTASLSKGLNIQPLQLLSRIVDSAINRVNEKFNTLSQELFKLLKIGDSSLSSMIELTRQIQLTYSIIDILNTIIDTQGDYNPCGLEAGKAFFTHIRIPGQKIRVRETTIGTVTDIEVDIIPEDVVIDNPIIKEILESNGIIITPNSIIDSIPISIRLSECLSGNTNV